MNLIEKRKYQEQISAYENMLDDISKALLNDNPPDEKTIRGLLAKSYGVLGTTKLLLNESEITMERDV
ncbi:hypothetical protein [Tetragenococcus halophilus]|uniref:Uncharacterized protein n=1 Tax=Tetragenococcus halophilus (strain DSM 20338 / JCM 20259 / NCIMB 9735 / NBRC 12172) TaxID=945021 RepID=A0AAN1SFP1_TETHN|nr:hypothetical protein [Tetragenococcus halophilus]BAK94178.1 hypothetical protein TEH_08510 [Tetragenococcus halophilus NBRC 12172]GBD70774.1 putative uncharacterized protein [Tetragenococcus halophilus subsp. halophilus]